MNNQNLQVIAIIRRMKNPFWKKGFTATDNPGSLQRSLGWSKGLNDLISLLQEKSQMDKCFKCGRTYPHAMAIIKCLCGRRLTEWKL